MAGNRVQVLALLLLGLVCVQGATIDYCEVLGKSLLFYEAQRSGRLPSTNRVPWRGNSALGDCTSPCTTDSNGDGNLAGGYYDAGDGVKFGLPAAWSLTTLAWGLLEFKDAVVACNQYSYYLDTLKWGLDWFIKAHPSANVLWGQVGNGGADHAYWGPPETMTMSRPAYEISSSKPGTELAMEAAAAFAAGHLVFKAAGQTAYANTLLTHATQLWSFGDQYRGGYTSSISDAGAYYNSWSGYNDELVWAHAWLYRATGTASYLTRAQSEYSSFDIPGKANGQSFDWDNKAPGVVVLMYQITGSSSYLSNANTWLNWWKPGGGITYTPGGLAWIREWGPARYAASSAFLAAVLAGSSGDISWTRSQVNYLLGANPQSQSFVVGAGVGSKSPINPHHRAAHGSTTNDINNPTNNKYLLVGALVGGPSSNDAYTDSRTDYVRNEVAIDYNAGWSGALAALAARYPTGYDVGATVTTTGSAGTSASGTSGTGSCGAGNAAASGCNGLKFKLNSSNNQDWWAINAPIEGIAAAVQIVEIKASGSSSWQILTWNTWGAWSYSGSTATPVSVRVTLCNGVVHTLENLFTNLNSNAEFCGVPTTATTGSTTTSTTAKATTGSTSTTTSTTSTTAKATTGSTTTSTTSTTAKATTGSTTSTTSTTAKATTGSTTSTTSTTAKATTGSTTTTTSTTAKATTGSTTTSTTAKSTTGSTSTTGTTTGSSTNPNVVVYADNSLQNAFENWSWATVNLGYTTTPRTGTTTVSVTINSAWAAFYIHKTDGIDTSKVKGIEFYIRLAAAGTAKNIKVQLLNDVNGSAVGVGSEYVITASSISTTYVRVYVDFAAIGAPTGVYDGFWIQDGVGATHPTYLVDDITLLGK